MKNTNNDNKIKQPKLSLKERYNDIFLQEAENRRKKLQYQRLHVGQINNPRLEHMIKLLYQLHQNYYFGYFEASCTLAGSMFEQSLMILLEEKMQEEGYISIYKFIKGKKCEERITNIEDLAQCNIGFLISIVNNYKMLPKREYDIAKTLQCIRNCVVHDMLPPFRINGKFYKADLKINLSYSTTKTISISSDEISTYASGETSIELWSYYLLTRTRELIDFLFKERVKKFPPDFL